MLGNVTCTAQVRHRLAMLIHGGILDSVYLGGSGAEPAQRPRATSSPHVGASCATIFSSAESGEQFPAVALPACCALVTCA